LRSCLEGFPAKHLSLIRFIATSVPSIFHGKKCQRCRTPILLILQGHYSLLPEGKKKKKKKDVRMDNLNIRCNLKVKNGKLSITCKRPRPFDIGKPGFALPESLVLPSWANMKQE